MGMEKMLVLKMRKDNAKRAAPIGAARLPIFFLCFLWFPCEANHSFGPAATKALPASFVVNFSKFLMKREDRSLAFSSHAFLSA